MIIDRYIAPGLSLLPPGMDTPEARAMLVAIGLQESRFEYRKQIRGPARGYWQFEEGGGIRGVLTHPATGGLMREMCDRLHVPAQVQICYGLVAYHDVLACIFARLLLWSLPWPLPEPWDTEKAWSQYIAAWRPGRPHRQTWDAFYRRAWETVK